MGNTSIANEFKSGKWKIIEKNPNRQILKNIQTHLQVEKHHTRSDFQNFDDRFQNTELYNWRKSLDSRLNIVKLYEFEIKEEMFGIQEEEYVYTERIERLNQKGKILSKAEGFLLILDFLNGFEILFEVFGIFNIDVLMLGISTEGKGKVWLNENFAKNQFQEYNIIQKPSQATELMIVNNLAQMVRQRIFNDDFMPQVQFPSNMTIKQTKEYIKLIRNQQALFQIDKVYLDRSEYKLHNDILLKKSVQSTYQPPIQNFKKVSHQQNHVVPVQYEQLKGENSTNTKTKKDHSETLSSDSNSRSKLGRRSLVQSDLKNKQKKSKQFIYKNRVEEAKMSNLQDPKSARQLQNQKQETFLIRNQTPVPYLVRENIPFQPLQVKREVHRQPNIQAKGQTFVVNPHFPPIENYMNSVEQAFEKQVAPGLIQRKIVKYRPLVQGQLQNVVYQQYPGRVVQVQQIPIQPYYIQQNQVKMNKVYQNPQTFLPKPTITHIDNRRVSPRRETNQPQEDLSTMDLNWNRLNFIENVELCESVIFDRSQIEQNWQDLHK